MSIRSSSTKVKYKYIYQLQFSTFFPFAIWTSRYDKIVNLLDWGCLVLPIQVQVTHPPCPDLGAMLQSVLSLQHTPPWAHWPGSHCHLSSPAQRPSWCYTWSHGAPHGHHVIHSPADEHSCSGSKSQRHKTTETRTGTTMAELMLKGHCQLSPNTTQEKMRKGK